jgi:ATP-dependent Clp endopeptidase proteolytic subunit ClpP
MTEDEQIHERYPTPEETALTIARTEKVRAETLKANSEAENARNMAVVARLAREGSEREVAKDLASDEHHRVYRFSTGISDGSVKLAINALTLWGRLYPGEDIEVIFNSGGGDVVSGMALFDFILDLRAQGHKITTSTLGVAASMAGILLQAGDKRTMGREAWLMIHEASFRAEGKVGEVEDTVDWIKKVQERVLHIFANRSKMTVEEIREKWLRRNWWISSDEALTLGLVDALR